MLSFLRPMMCLNAALIVFVCLCSTGCDPASDQATSTDALPIEDQPANPSGRAHAVLAPETTTKAHLTNPPADPRVAIQEMLANGQIPKEASATQMLAMLLKAAGIAESSQVLVFSKTSLQDRLISPSNPRAIYFNDDCYIGYVPGGLIEYGDTDPDPDIVSGFYSLDPAFTHEATLDADRSCLSCHDGARTDGGPGFLVRSGFPDQDGRLILSEGTTNVGHDTPIEKRWGGWYVTGQSGGLHHRGNQVTTEQPDGDASINNARGSNLNDLSGRFAIETYLQPTSDIVALMVLEHQVQMHNQLTQGAARVRKQIARSKKLAAYLDEPFDPTTSETLQRVIASRTQKIVRHLLFCDEVLLSDPIVGSALFQREFRANRLEDRHGRSLKDFDLQTRIFCYRCSYMVYSRAFETMPTLLKDAVLAKLVDALQGRSAPALYEHLDLEEREAILEILVETGVVPVSLLES